MVSIMEPKAESSPYLKQTNTLSCMLPKIVYRSKTWQRLMRGSMVLGWVVCGYNFSGTVFSPTRVRPCKTPKLFYNSWALRKSCWGRDCVLGLRDGEGLHEALGCGSLWGGVWARDG